MEKSTKILIYLIILAVFDVAIPIPIAAIILIYVLLAKPAWFKDLVSEEYTC
jgi:hypothetical protein